MITEKHLRLAGWLALLYGAFYVIISAELMYNLADFLFHSIPDSVLMSPVIIALAILGTVIFIYVMLALRKLLNSYYQFHNVDFLILAIILISIIELFVMITVQEILNQPPYSSILTFWLVVSVLDTVLFVVFAIMLLRIPGNLFGLLKPFCIIVIVSALSPQIIEPFGSVVYSASYVVLALVFFRARERIASETAYPASALS